MSAGHVFNTWKCGHARRPYNGLSRATNAELADLAKHAATLTWRRLAADELRDRRQSCPACKASDRRALRQAMLLTLFAAVLLLVTCEARSATTCAPYTPTNGRTCEPPTRLREWRGLPVCVCLPEGVAGR